MANLEKQTTFYESMLNKLLIKIRNYYCPLFFSLFVGFLNYMFLFTNKLVNHDEIQSTFTKGATVSSGRWGLRLLSFLFPDYSMPWIYGVISLILFSIAICIIITTFNFKNKIFQCILGGIIISFPSLLGTFCYMFTSSSYAIAFILAVGAVYYLKQKGIKYYLTGIIMMILSLSIYQAYLSVIASLLLLIIIQALFNNNTNLKDIIIDGFIYIILMILALSIYYGLTQLSLVVLNAQFNDYASESINDFVGINQILQNISLAYKNFIYYFVGKFGMVNSVLSKLLHIICLLTVFFSLFSILKTKSFTRIICILTCIALLPLGINLLYLFTAEGSIHTLVLYSFISIYIFAVIIIEEYSNATHRNGLMKDCIYIILTLLIINNTYISNKAQLQLHLAYENTYAFYGSLVSQIKSMPGFYNSTKLAIIGESNNPINFVEKFLTYDIMGPVSGKDLINAYSKNNFIKYYIGFNVQFASKEEIEHIQSLSEFKKMSIYPYYGSIQLIDGFMVVKFE